MLVIWDPKAPAVMTDRALGIGEVAKFTPYRLR